MDANSNPNDEKSHVAVLREECQLFDPINLVNPAQINTPTYIHGSARIDVFLISNELSQAVRGANILPYQSITTSDHLAR